MADEPNKKPEEQRPTPRPTQPRSTLGDIPIPHIDPAVLEAAIKAALKMPDFQPPILKMPDILGLPSFRVPELTLPTVDTSLSTSFRTFERELVTLRKQVDEQAKALRDEKVSAREKERKIGRLQSALDELQAKERLGFLLTRVNPRAQRELLASDAFRQRFLGTTECAAFVMSVDIRRSTELMLKARRPEEFARFITTLCGALMTIITENFGVFDKFTGDGVLAFFPDFYSGTDAAYYAMSAADKCHARWDEHYRFSRRSFTSILADIGLGIGLDYGPVHLVQVAGGLTVVGTPVVYACRLSGAPPGLTVVNQPAYEVISDRFAATCFIDERTLEIKHEGTMLAYSVRLNGRDYTPKDPDWTTSDTEAKSSNA